MENQRRNEENFCQTFRSPFDLLFFFLEIYFCQTLTVDGKFIGFWKIIKKNENENEKLKSFVYFYDKITIFILTLSESEKWFDC